MTEFEEQCAAMTHHQLVVMLGDLIDHLREVEAINASLKDDLLQLHCTVDELCCVRVDSILSVDRMRKAIWNLYVSAYWTPDRAVDAETLWEELRNSAGIRPGNSPKPHVMQGV